MIVLLMKIDLRCHLQTRDHLSHCVKIGLNTNKCDMGDLNVKLWNFFEILGNFSKFWNNAIWCWFPWYFLIYMYTCASSLIRKGFVVYVNSWNPGRNGIKYILVGWFRIRGPWISETPFTTHSCGQHVKHLAMIHPSKTDWYQLNGVTWCLHALAAGQMLIISDFFHESVRDMYIYIWIDRSMYIKTESKLLWYKGHRFRNI